MTDINAISIELTHWHRKIVAAAITLYAEHLERLSKRAETLALTEDAIRYHRTAERLTEELAQPLTYGTPVQFFTRDCSAIVTGLEMLRDTCIKMARAVKTIPLGDAGDRVEIELDALVNVIVDDIAPKFQDQGSLPL